MKKTLILGVGNSLLGDDGVGLYAANQLKKKLSASSIDVVASEETGYRLLDILDNYQRLILIDSIEGISTRKSVVRLTARDFRMKSHTSSSHQVGIFNMLKIGRKLGLSMPSRVIIYGVPIKRQRVIFCQTISGKMKKTVPRLLGLIKKEVESWP